jgi:CRP-like cAMP-binding protein
MADVRDTSIFKQNGLLAGLTRSEKERLLPQFEVVTLKLTEVVFVAGSEIKELYFPTTAVISTVALIGDGLRVETSLIGNDGVVGVSAFLGVSRTANESIVQSAGDVLVIRAKTARKEFRRVGPFHDAILLYTHVLLTQVAQTATCNRHHTVEERLSRWLLMMLDRVESNTLTLTQEFLSWMLGVRNTSVSIAAISLQDAGIIEYSRGQIVILNRKGLEESACGCHSLLKSHFARLGI